MTATIDRGAFFIKLYLPRYEQLNHSTAEVYLKSMNDLRVLRRSAAVVVRDRFFLFIARIDKPRDDDAEEVQRDHRRREDRLVHRIAGRRDDRRDDEGEK